MIGGNSTSCLTAIMLGRLHKAIHKFTNAYTPAGALGARIVSENSVMGSRRSADSLLLRGRSAGHQGRSANPAVLPWGLPGNISILAELGGGQ